MLSATMSRPPNPLAVRVAVHGASYGVLCFAAGFIFGAIRELILIPTFGNRMGHLIEFPAMLVAVGLIAHLCVRRNFAGSSMWARLALGMIGMIVLVGIESTFAMIIMGMPLATYLAGYDVTNGALFPFGLLWVVGAPVVLGRRR